MDKLGFNQPLLVKKSPVVIAKTFIVLQLAAVSVFFLSGVLIDYGEIYKHLPIVGSLSFHIAEAIGIFLTETVIVFFIFFRWYKEYYDIKLDKIIYGRGIIFRLKTAIPIRSVHSVSYRQGPLGRLTKYGSVYLTDSNGKRFAVLDHIPEPQKYTELIVSLKEQLQETNGGSAGTISIEDLISRGEHHRLEFKTSFRWDDRQNKVNKNLEKAAMKTFINSGGGQLLIGVDDSGSVIGLEKDYKSLPKPNSDGFHNHFTNVFHMMIGPEFRQFVKLTFHKTGDKEYCLIQTASGDRPAYLKFDEQEEFYIRTGNGTTALKLSEASSYIDSRWKTRLL